VLNASGQSVTAGTTGTFINPVRQLTGPTGTTYAVSYITDTNEMVYSNSLAGNDYGEIYFSNPGTTTQPTTGFINTVQTSVWTNTIKTIGIVAGQLNNVRAQLPNGTLVASLINNRPGIFLINFKASIRTVVATTQFAGAIFLNSVIAPNIVTQTLASTSANNYFITGSGLSSLAANTTVDVRFNANATNTNLIFLQYNLNIVKIA
jgi:hypothetical protein